MKIPDVSINAGGGAKLRSDITSKMIAFCNQSVCWHSATPLHAVTLHGWVAVSLKGFRLANWLKVGSFYSNRLQFSEHFNMTYPPPPKCFRTHHCEGQILYISGLNETHDFDNLKLWLGAFIQAFVKSAAMERLFPAHLELCESLFHKMIPLWDRSDTQLLPRLPPERRWNQSCA